MGADGWPRHCVVARCALTYPLVWPGAALVGFVAAATSGVETGTRGLGHFLAGFGIGVIVLSVLWTVVSLLAMLEGGHPVRSAVAAVVPPLLVVGCAMQSFTLASVCALTVPYAACSWATRPDTG